MTELQPAGNIRHHRLFASLGAALLILATALILPDAGQAAPRVPLLVPVFSSAQATLNAIIAYLVLLQFHMERNYPDALVSIAFAYSALLTVILLVSLPGVLVSNEHFARLSPALGWLWVAKVTGHALLILLAMLCWKKWPARRVAEGDIHSRTAIAALVPVLLSGAACAFVNGAGAGLPPLQDGNGSYAALARGWPGMFILTCWAGALLSVLLVTRLRRSFDCWLAFSCLAYLLYLTLNFTTASRFTTGWYLSRFFELSASAALLGALLFEVLRMQRQLKRLYHSAYQTSIRDGLTGLFSRRYFDAALEQAEMLRTRRPLSLLMIDIDFFKQYNDAYGHPAGDDCLRQVATCLQEGARSSDIVARYGGEEFAVILPDTDVNEARLVAERLRNAVMAQGIPAAATVPADKPVVTVSVGLGCRQSETRTAAPSTLLSEADRALYDAKRQGRNQVACRAL
ncbi:MAG: GGDEF domain-containing protein [Microvirgula sp.]